MGGLCAIVLRLRLSASLDWNMGIQARSNNMIVAQHESRGTFCLKSPRDAFFISGHAG